MSVFSVLFLFFLCSRLPKLVEVARYTDVTVRYIPRFGGHGSIYDFGTTGEKRNLLCSVSFHLF